MKVLFLRDMRVECKIASTSYRYVKSALILTLTPSGCIAPHSDAILICYELPPLLPPRLFPSLASPC